MKFECYVRIQSRAIQVFFLTVCMTYTHALRGSVRNQKEYKAEATAVTMEGGRPVGQVQQVLDSPNRCLFV